MSNQAATIQHCIDSAAATVSKAWPLYSFVTANPLSGFEDQPFEKAVMQARKLFGINGFPSPQMLRQAWEEGQIEPELLRQHFTDNGIDQSPEEHLQYLSNRDKNRKEGVNPSAQLDHLVVKWLSAFMDEGMAEWWMPNRHNGFYQSWRELAPFDGQIPNARQIGQLPEDPIEAIDLVLSHYSTDVWEAILTEQLAALPGWTGFIKYRIEQRPRWQQLYPIKIADLLAVRLSLAFHLGYDLQSAPSSSAEDVDKPPEAVWLSAWEQSYHKPLLEEISASNAENAIAQNGVQHPHAQLVFCIDTRSEIIRRHIEQAGAYETFGYAGFFGIPMDYQGYHSSLVKKSCPPILSSAYHMTDQCDTGRTHLARNFNQWYDLTKVARKVLNTFKNNVPASFGYVEGAGGFYGINLTTRTLFPRVVYQLTEKLRSAIPNPVQFCFPSLQTIRKDEPNPPMPIEDRVACAKAAFTMTGWENFARLVVFVGHGSKSANNPYGSSLDCGACAGNPGRHNARALAAICNDPEVRSRLADEGITIPDETVFVAAEHNTTTDAVELFDNHVPVSHHDDLAQLRKDLAQAREGAARERLASMQVRGSGGIDEVQRKSSDWAETRPEWGLATNAAFVVGPRSLTKELNLNGRCFLHSYDWSQDADGSALQAIMNGPMVVTQWINNHYYFATVDNDSFGSGSKVTQNVIGKFGVVQGNGGDLRSGLPLQSLKEDDERLYHQPLRLMVLIHAPLQKVQNALKQSPSVARLVTNEWIHLRVMDPEQNNKVLINWLDSKTEVTT